MNEKHQLRSKILGVLVRDARCTAGKSVEACASFLGIPPAEMTRIEQGERPISLPELEAFAYCVDITLDHFWGDQLLVAGGTKQVPTPGLLALRNRVVGVLLRQAREQAGKTQQECAEALGTEETTLNEYEMGLTPVPLAHLESLADLLQVPIENFVDREHNPQITPAAAPTVSEVGPCLDHLPEDLQSFLLEPLNEDYIRTAQRLSEMPTDKLRGIAETLLELTY